MVVVSHGLAQRGGGREEPSPGRVHPNAGFFERGGLGVAAAAEVGYADPSYFSRCFKRVVGLSLRAYLRRAARSRDGQLMAADEPEQKPALTGSRPDAG
ncbi:MAG: helix-turn-helix domain-containing protein [Salipiger thiooxidans]|uniref:helix-turn-helix domain-containing protein n=1 Tax=Salipiger thiooxidans TaxID=282683 RepID=UPI001CF9A754|nr:AraC family transcriptional regulator [Salipiger thiooxidans]